MTIQNPQTHLVKVGGSYMILIPLHFARHRNIKQFFGNGTVFDISCDYNSEDNRIEIKLVCEKDYLISPKVG